MPPPLVSVIMPVRNAAAHLSESLSSIWAQHLDDLELLVIDDGSTDSTVDLLERERDKRLRILANAGQPGIADALNTGLAAARGQLIARMDADDRSVPRRLSKQVRVLERQAAGVVGSDVRFMSSDGRATRRRSHLPASEAGVRLHLHLGNCLPHPTVVARRDVLEAVGGYRLDRPAGEDYDLWLRLLGRTAMVNVAEPLLHYRVHEANTSTVHLRPGAEAISAPLAAALSTLLQRAVPPRTAEHLLVPSLSRHDDELLDAARLVRDVLRAAQASGDVPRYDRVALRRRADEIVARLAVAALRRRPSLLSEVLRGAPTSAVRGAARTATDRVRSRLPAPADDLRRG